jgi:hypothetical protein
MMPDEPAAQRSGSLPEDPADFFRRLGEQTSKVLTAAEEAAREIREQARKDAAAILADARLQADELARKAAAQRRAAEEELRKFREARTILANQIEDVHRRFEEIILRLRTPVDAPDTAPPASAPPASAPPASAPPASAPPGRGAGAAMPGRAREPEAPAAPATPAVAASAEPGAAAVDGVSGALSAVIEESVVAAEPLPPEVGEFEAAEQAEVVAEATASSEVAELVGLAQAQPVPGVVAPPQEPVQGEQGEPAGQPEQPEAAAVPGQFADRPLTAPAVPAEAPAAAAVAPEATPRSPESEAFLRRAEALGDIPLAAARGLKRLLQEDQNDLLDRIRRGRGRGTFERDILPAEVQVERFGDGMRSILEPAFLAGRSLGGAPALGESPDTVGALVTKQVVAPLRRDLARMIEPRMAAGDTVATVSERAGDVYRVWKGVRTELLGEGLAFAAFHYGLLEAWREGRKPGKRWVLSSDEADCPRDTCRSNAAAGVVPVDASFPSGHLAPPAHGACNCTVIAGSM